MDRTLPPKAIIEVAGLLLETIDDLGLRLAQRFLTELDTYRIDGPGTG
ncbi:MULTISPECIES: hypothetical protein [Mycobacteriales]